MDVIDLEKTRQAFDFLAETPRGHAALDNLKKAFDKLQGEVQPNLNRGEFLYLLRGLVGQLTVNPPATEPAEVAGYAFGNVQGAIFQGQAGAAKLSGLPSNQRFMGINRITPGGFTIRPEI